ncbi:MAG: hypothetical protein PSX80_05650 [bacterium]|nr:hypothetical protein [bacterium]
MVRNIIGVIVGIVVASIVNMALVAIGHANIPLPPGADVSSMERLSDTIHLFGPQNYIFVFLAHALGPLAGTFVTMLIAVSHKMKTAVGMAVFFLLGGIAASVMIPAPLWFKAVDLIFAYVPMTLLGAKLGGAGTERR